jgi:hypothetical protein
MSIYLEGTGENIFLIEGNVQKQLSEERLGLLRVPGIKDAVATVYSEGCLLTRVVARSIGSDGSCFSENVRRAGSGLPRE